MIQWLREQFCNHKMLKKRVETEKDSGVFHAYMECWICGCKTPGVFVGGFKHKPIVDPITTGIQRMEATWQQS